MSKNELLEMISNLEVQLNEAEDKITMSTHLQVSKINCKSKTVLTLRILKEKKDYNLCSEIFGFNDPFYSTNRVRQ